jgi:dTMP kinase
MRGFFITFEGGEGSGKSTQIAALCAALRAEGRAVVETQDPGGTPLGADVRRLLLDPARVGMAPVAELLLYEASRAQLVAEVIRPALGQGRIVVCDRFTHSTAAYQGYGRGLELRLVERLNGLAAAGVEPDCTFLLDLDPVLGLARVRARTPEDRMEAEELDFHQRVRAGFLALAARRPDRIHVLDATRPAEEVAGRVRDRVAALLGAARAAR